MSNHSGNPKIFLIAFTDGETNAETSVGEGEKIEAANEGEQTPL